MLNFKIILGQDWSSHYSQQIAMTLAKIPAKFSCQRKIQFDLRYEDKLNLNK